VNNNHNNTSVASSNKIHDNLAEDVPSYSRAKLSTQTTSTMIIRWIKGEGSNQLQTTINQYFNSDNNINDEEECHTLWKGDRFMVQGTVLVTTTPTTSVIKKKQHLQWL
jgi:hypothetical protein